MLLNYLQVINVDNNKIIIFISLLEFALLCFVLFFCIFCIDYVARIFNIPHTRKKYSGMRKKETRRIIKKGQKGENIYLYIFFVSFIYLFFDLMRQASKITNPINFRQESHFYYLLFDPLVGILN